MKDPRDSIASTNNNKKSSDSERSAVAIDPVTGTSTPIGYSHFQGTKLSEMSDTEKDLMYSKQDEAFRKLEEEESKLFGQGVEALRTKNKDLAKSLDFSKLSKEQVSDVKALGRHGDMFTQDGNSASWSGKFYENTKENLNKNYDLVKRIFNRNKYGGVKHSSPIEGVSGTGTFADPKMKKFFQTFRNNQGTLLDRDQVLRRLYYD